MLGIILVDDHYQVRETVSNALRRRDEVVVLGEARNGLEAVDLVRRLRPDVVLMDLHMPVMDGVEATRRIRREHPETQVLAFSSSGADVDVAAAMEAGARGYVLKGTHVDQLVEAVCSAAGEAD